MLCIHRVRIPHPITTLLPALRPAHPGTDNGPSVDPQRRLHFQVITMASYVTMTGQWRDCGLFVTLERAAT